MERVAFGYSDQCKESSLNNTVSKKSQAGICRTRGIETAGWENKRRDKSLIYSDENKRYIPHAISGTFYPR